MGNLRKKVPELFDHEGVLIPRQGLLGLWRDGGAGGTFWCADVCAGVAETTDIRLAAMKEAVEVSFYDGNAIGVVQNHMFDANGEMDTADGIRYDDANVVLQNETLREWSKLLGERPATLVTLQSTMQKCIADYGDLDGHCYNISVSTEPDSGSVEVVYRVTVDLPEVEGGWHVRDTEHMELRGDYVALNRRPVLIVPVEGQAPVLLGFSSEGLDPHGTIARLDRNNLEMLTNSKVRAVLSALGWLPQS